MNISCIIGHLVNFSSKIKKKNKKNIVKENYIGDNMF